MKAMILKEQKKPLVLEEIPRPTPGRGQILIEISACGLCRTDLHVVDGDLGEPVLPLVPGHQIVGRVLETGEGVGGFTPGERVGVPWLGESCGRCPYCKSGRENLCDNARYTGYQINGGFAEFCAANARFCFPVPERYPDIQAAPLLCAGLIGYRALRMAGDGRRIGLYGFGAAAHIVIQIIKSQGRHAYAFTRTGDVEGQDFARTLGAEWAGASGDSPPSILDSAIIFAPVGALVPEALKSVAKGGVVVCAGIHMSDIPGFPYSLLWGERVIRSVANLTRQDGVEFLALAPKIPVRTEVHTYSLERVNEALDDLRHGRFTGAAVIAVQ